MGRVSPDYYVQDGVVPRTRLPDVLRRIADLSDEYGLRVGNVFHAGDGNLHPLVLYDAEQGEAGRAKELAEAILAVCLDAGGSLTGEHGVGVDKACAMPQMFSERDLETVRATATGFRSGRARESRQGAADAEALRRGAGAVPDAPSGEDRACRAFLAHRPASRMRQPFSQTHMPKDDAFASGTTSSHTGSTACSSTRQVT